MQKFFKPTLLSNLRLLLPQIGTSVCFIFGNAYFKMHLNIFSIILFNEIVTFGIVAIAIHIQYLFYDYNKRLYFYDDRIEIKTNNVVSISKEDIQKIVLYENPWRNVVRASFIATRPYFYVCIVSKSNEMFFVTSLISSNIDEKLQEWSGMKIEKESSFFAFIEKHSH